MAEGVLFNIAEEILKNLGSGALHEIAAAWGFKSRLERLNNTIQTVKNLLLDAQDRQVHSHAIRGWLLRLQAAVYDADDLFDEFSTIASQKRAMKGNKLTSKVRMFFSHSNPIVVAFTISQKIKRIREDLDVIVKDGGEFQFVLRPTEEGWILKAGQHRGETGYFVHAQDVIGREEDKNAILAILLNSSNCTEAVSVVPIVGMGGMGKTTLAQLLYNDKIVEQHFELRLWVCVGEVFDEKEIVKKILMSATDTEPQNLGMGQLQSRLRQAVGGRKFLLVLDDVWNEHREKWVKLTDLLKDNKEGSKILVTTRSTRVAKVTGTVPAYLLSALSPEKSWALFRKVAFGHEEEYNNPYLVEAGKEILKMCGNVPLAIRSLGSLLYGQDERKWLSIKECGSLAKISEDGNDIMPILKLSYNHLISALRHCFAYCALFPKDYVFQKETMISLWMAEGFLLSKNGSQGELEDVGEDYFGTLVQRCFFQDVVENEWGNIGSFKVHDLLHDLAQEVAGAESIVARFEDTHLDKRIRHLSLGYRMKSTQSIPGYLLDLKPLRTLLLPKQEKDGLIFSKPTCSQLILSFRCLRVLDLNNLGVDVLPSSIGKLIHLRYLNLTYNLIRTLPSSITNLQNLQTLNLYSTRLESLPKDISKLINLRSLDVGECHHLSHMPGGMGALTCLHKLNYFVVKGEDPSRPRSGIGQLRDMKSLNSLKGRLVIKFKGEVREPLIEAKEANLSSKHGVTDLCLQGRGLYTGGNVKDNEIKHDEEILEGLKPHPILKKLKIGYWRGEKLPSWAVVDNLSICLPNLVDIEFIGQEKWKELPSFGQLKFLKRLSLYGLKRVEYIEKSPCLFKKELEQGPPLLLFPSLEVLQLQYMNSLRGWWKYGREEEEEATESWTSFPNLSILEITLCQKLKSIPMCPNVKGLTLMGVNEELTETVLKMASEREREIGSMDGSSSSSSRSNRTGSVQLKTLKIDKVQYLIRLPKECLQHLSSLEIIWDKEVENTKTLEQVFKTSVPCLRQLSFIDCNELKRGTPGLHHLTALEHLSFQRCDSLEIEKEGNENGMPWKALSKNLRSLELRFLGKMEYIPEGIKYLTNLRSLDLALNEKLKEVPEWIGCLSSLHLLNLSYCQMLKSLPERLRQLTNLNTLDISNCPDLKQRCQGLTGQDWPNIQHVPLVVYWDY